MSFFKSQSEIVAFWKANEVLLKSNIKYNSPANHVILLIPPITAGLENSDVNLKNILLLDTVEKILNKLGIKTTKVYGFNCQSPLIELDAGVKFLEYNEQFQGTPGQFAANIEEDLNWECGREFLKMEKKWWDIINNTGFPISNQYLYYTIDRTFTELLWYLLGKLWSKGRLNQEYFVNYYWPSRDIYLENDIISSLLDQKSGDKNLGFSKSKLETLICSYKLDSGSGGKLSFEILRETENLIISEQNIYKQLIIDLIEIKELGHISKAEKRGDLFFNLKYDVKTGLDFKIAKIRKPNWEIWEVDEEIAPKVQEIKEKLDLIEDNIIVLESIYSILETETDIRILSWEECFWGIPATTALAVNEMDDYSLYYLEDQKVIVILAESQAIPILSMLLPVEMQPGDNLEMLIENKVDGGEYFNSVGAKIHKLVSLPGGDLINLNYQSFFNPEMATDQEGQDNLNIFKIVNCEGLNSKIGSGVFHVYGAHSEKWFNLSKQNNLPIIETIDKSGHYIFQNTITRSDFTKYSKISVGSLELANLITDIVDELDGIFSTVLKSVSTPAIFWNKSKIPEIKTNYKSKYNTNLPAIYDENITKTIEEAGFDARDKIKESLFPIPNLKWTTKAISPNSKSLLEINVTENRAYGVPFPLWKSKDNHNLFIENIQQLLDFSLNPIYTLVNKRDLEPELYVNGLVVILGDKNTKLPLGLNAVQYRSNALTEMRREKNVTIKHFSIFGEKLLSEIFEIYQKHTTVQILLEPNEQELLTIWLGGYSPKSKNIEEKFYFYKPLVKLDFDLIESGEIELENDTIVVQDFGRGEIAIKKIYFKPSSEIKQLKLQKPYIDEILLQDNSGRLYKRTTEIISSNYINAILMDGKIWHDLILTEKEKNLYFKVNDTSGFYSSGRTNQNIFSSKSQLLIQAKHSELIPYKFDLNKFVDYNFFPENIDLFETNLTEKSNIYSTENKLNYYGSDLLRLAVLLSINKINTNNSYIDPWDEKKLGGLFTSQSSLISGILKHVQQTFNKYPKNNPPLTKHRFKHFLNNWWQIYTLNYCLQLMHYLNQGELAEASKLYLTYLNNFSNWYIRCSRSLDLSFHVENSDLIGESLSLFSIFSSPLQPFTSESIYQLLPQSKWQNFSAFYSNFPETQEISPAQVEILDQMQSLKNSIIQIEKVRRHHKIKLRQPLYCDFSRLEIPAQVLDLFLIQTNLLAKPENVNSSNSKIIETNFGKLKIDLEIYEELAAIAFGWELERTVIEFLKRNRFNRDQSLVFKWQITNCENEELVYKVVNCLDWIKLNIEVRWDQNLKEEESLVIEIKDLAKILVQKI